MSKRSMEVSRARTKLALQVLEFQDEHDLTDIELLQALNEVEGTVLKYMLRAERHPEDPDKAADIE